MRGDLEDANLVNFVEKREENYYQILAQRDEPVASFGKLIIFDDLDLL